MKRVKVSAEEFGSGSVAPITCPTCGIESHPWLAHTHPDNLGQLQDILYHTSLFKHPQRGEYVFDRDADGTVYPAHWHMNDVTGEKTLTNGEKCRGGKNCTQAHRAAMVRMAMDYGAGTLGRQWTRDETVGGPDLSHLWNPFAE